MMINSLGIKISSSQCKGSTCTQNKACCSTQVASALSYSSYPCHKVPGAENKRQARDPHVTVDALTQSIISTKFADNSSQHHLEGSMTMSAWLPSWLHGQQSVAQGRQCRCVYGPDLCLHKPWCHYLYNTLQTSLWYGTL